MASVTRTSPSLQGQGPSGIIRDTQQSSEPAPRSDVPANLLTCIEHPCIIKNVDKGIKSLGGQVILERFLNFTEGDAKMENTPKKPGQLKMDPIKQKKTIGVSLRPDDLTAKPIPSRKTTTNNVLLKVSVPRRTGRRRKRGSTDPFVAPSEESRPVEGNVEAVHSDPRRVTRSLRDNPSNYSFQAIGVITETHRFRNLPDAQFAATADSFSMKIREHILPMQYSEIIKFRLIDEKCKAGSVPGPAAEFLRLGMPFNYQYLQNPLTYFAKDEHGIERAANSNKFQKPKIQTVEADAPTVPSSPSPLLVPEDQQTASVRKVIRELRQYFEHRPICSSRVLNIDIATAKQNKFYVALAYIGYAFSAGPWKRTIIKYGHDPRTHPNYRKFQTISFQLDHRILNPETHAVGERYKNGSIRAHKIKKPIYTFDGESFTPDHQVWQMCDISDPQLRPLLDTNNLRTECDTQMTGWYHQGTIAKIKVVMRDKMTTKLQGGTIDNDNYLRVLTFPDILTRQNVSVTRLRSAEAYSEAEMEMTKYYRGLATPLTETARQRLRMLRGEDVEADEETGETGEEMDIEETADGGDASKDDMAQLREFEDASDDENEEPEPDEPDEEGDMEEDEDEQD